MRSIYCIECGRELNEYMSETLHYCNICETRLSKKTFVYEKVLFKPMKIYKK